MCALMLRLLTSTRRHLRSTRGCTVGDFRGNCLPCNPRGGLAEGPGCNRCCSSCSIASSSPRGPTRVTGAPRGRRSRRRCLASCTCLCPTRLCCVRTACASSPGWPRPSQHTRGSCCPRRPPQRQRRLLSLSLWMPLARARVWPQRGLPQMHQPDGPRSQSTRGAVAPTSSPPRLLAAASTRSTGWRCLRPTRTRSLAPRTLRRL